MPVFTSPRPLRAFGLLPLVACASSAPAPDPAASLGQPISDEEARAVAADALAPLLPGHGISGLDALRVRDIRVDEDGEMDVRVQQTLDGVEVEGGQAIVELDGDGELVGVTDHLVDGVDVDTVAAVDEDTATEVAVRAAGGWRVLTDDPRVSLVISSLDGAPRLVWRVQTARIDGTEHTAALLVRVDAQTGEVLSITDSLRRLAGTGTSNYSGTVPLKMVIPDGSSYYYLEDSNRRFATLSMLGTDDSATHVFDADTAFDWSWQRQAVDAHFAAQNLLEYFDKDLVWKGLSGTTGPGTVDSLYDDGTVIGVYVDYGDGYSGAFWYDGAAYFGNGDGLVWDPLTALDIVGHELTHGVTEAIVGFDESGEAASIDEGYADVFGAMAERYLEGETGGTWKIGEDAYTPDTPYDAAHYLNDPARDGLTIDHYDDYDAGATPSVNMGILTLAYYLLSEGGRHPTYGGTTMTGVGADEAELIAFRGLFKYSSSSMTYADTRNAWLDAAIYYNGADSEQYEAVMNAWALVGVGPSAAVSTCTDFDHPFSGTLTEAGTKYFPSSRGQSYGSGTFSAALEGPDSTDFDLFLQVKGTDGRFTNVARSRTAGSSTESLSYTGAAGTYRVLVKSFAGSGDFVACLDRP